MGRMDGKVALISGGARGMGASEARLFAREGAAVVIGDILDEEGEATAASIEGDGGRCRFVHLDVTQEVDWQTAVAEALSQFGSLDVLVNNAGIGSSSFEIHEEPVELVGPHHRREPEGRLFGHTRRRARHAGGRRWFHH